MADAAVPMTHREGETALPEFDLGALGWTAELADTMEPGLVPGRVTAAHRAAFANLAGRL